MIDVRTRSCRAAALALLVLLVAASPALARGGKLDPSFATGGVFAPHLGQGASPWSVFDAISPLNGGRSVAAATASTADGSTAGLVVRLTSGGVLDPSFGSGGVWTGPRGSELNALAVASNGKLIVAGNLGDGLLVARLNSDGTLDDTFGQAGVVTQQPPDPFSTLTGLAVAVDSDGTVLVAVGDTFSGGSDTELDRFTSSGALDTSFGQGGSVSFDFAQEHPAVTSLPALGINRQGKVLLGGSATGANIDMADNAVLTRVNRDGSTSRRFGQGGVTWPLGDSGEGFISALALWPDGRILVTGQLSQTNKVFVARLWGNGRIDRSFGDRGFVKFQAGQGAHPYSEGDAIALQPGGRMLISGTASRRHSRYWGFVAQLTANGRMVRKFGSRGIALISAAVTSQSQAIAIAIGGNNRALLIGDPYPNYISNNATWIAAVTLR